MSFTGMRNWRTLLVIFDVQKGVRFLEATRFQHSDICSLNFSIPLQSSIVMIIPAEDIRNKKTFVSSTKAEGKHTFGVRI